VIKGFKGFDQKLQCRGFQYEIGGEYEEKKAKACEAGFHFCENPLDVFNYYPPADSRYAEVEGDGKIDKHDSDSKVACTRLKVGAELKLSGLIEAGVKFILDRVDWKNAKESNTGDRSAATNTGYRSAATNTGYQSAATNTGDRSAATNTGDQSAATNTGDQSAATNTGYQSAATNTGDQSAATNTGYRSAATNTGYRSAATNTGYQSAAEVSGKSCIAIASGYYGRAKANEGSAIVLCRYDSDGNMTHVKSAIAGKDCKADVWYTLGETGELEEVA
jgi:hypothetical protein